MANNLLQMAQPASTNVHNNIDNLILQADLDKFDKTGVMYADKTPQYIGGADDVVANVALGPLLTLKSLGGVGKKLLERTGLRNPVSHYTTSQGATNILKSKNIYGTGKFPGKNLIGGTRAVSVTRDPMFTSRPHSSIGTDVRFILDRDEMFRKGFNIKPYAGPNYRKTLTESLDLDHYKEVFGKHAKQMNPRFEFEERIRDKIPVENIKLIDLLSFPQGAGQRFNAAKILNQLAQAKAPIIRSSETTDQIKLMDEMFRKYRPQNRRYSGSTLQENLNRLLEAPTY